jgi:hypothetical protein
VYFAQRLPLSRDHRRSGGTPVRGRDPTLLI